MIGKKFFMQLRIIKENKSNLYIFINSLYGTLNALIICTFVFLSIFSHARAAYYDPGFVPLPKKGIDFSDVKANENNKVRDLMKNIYVK